MGTARIRAKRHTEIQFRDSVLLVAVGTEHGDRKHNAGDPNRIESDATSVTARMDIG
jgi:hypothetical protein